MNQEEDLYPVFDPPNNGLHKYLFRYACMCADEEIPSEDCRIHLDQCVDNLRYHRYVPPREITAAVTDAYRCVFEGPSETTTRFPDYDSSAANEIYREWMITIEDLESSSIAKPPTHPLEALQALFEPADLICMASRLERPSIVHYNRLQLGVAC